MLGVPIEQIRRNVCKYSQLNLYIKHVGPSLADDAQFHGCRFFARPDEKTTSNKDKVPCCRRRKCCERKSYMHRTLHDRDCEAAPCALPFRLLPQGALLAK